MSISYTFNSNFMKLFIKKNTYFFAPIIIVSLVLIVPFFLLDPFHIVKDYDKYYNSFVEYNEDYIATGKVLKSNNAYNSFMFGSSRVAGGFNIEYWKNKLSENDSAFKYAAAFESLFGIRGKMLMLDRIGNPIENVVICFDIDAVFGKLSNYKNHSLTKHPEVSGGNKRAFVATFLKDYIFSAFFIRYFDYLLFKTKRDYMSGYLFVEDWDYSEEYEPFCLLLRKEDMITKDSAGYYSSMSNNLYERDTIESMREKVITELGKQYLTDIKNIFDKHNTDYKIVINPLYDQLKINDEDLKILYHVFGNENVYDFSGKNRITDNKYNYYESSHFRPQVGKVILDSIY